MSFITYMSKKYLLYGLYENPFPPTGTPTRPWIMAGKSRMEALKILRTAIETCKNEKRRIGVRISGAHGQGKTHLMLHVRYLYSRDPRNLVVYSHCPSGPNIIPDLRRICELIFAELGEGVFLRQLALRLYAETMLQFLDREDWQTAFHMPALDRFLSFFSKKRRTRFRERLREVVEKNPFSVEEVLPYADMDAIRSETKKRILSRFQSSDVYGDNFVDERLLDIILSSDGKDWASFEKFFKESNDNALRTIKTVVDLLLDQGYQLLLLLLDEIERIETPKMETFLQSIAILLEHGPPCTCIVLACTPKVWGQILGVGAEPITTVGPALVRRMAYTVSLEGVTLDEAKELITAYLNDVRDERRREIYPFTEDALDLLWRRAETRPGDLLVGSYKAIEYASEIDAPVIDVAVAESALSIGLPPTAPTRPPIKPIPALKEIILDDFQAIKSPVYRTSKVGQALYRVLSALRRAGTISSVECSADYTKMLVTVDESKVAVKVVLEEGITEEDVEDLLALSKAVDRLIVLSTADVPIKEKEVHAIKLDDDLLAELIYATGVVANYRGVDLSEDEAKQVARDLGLMELLLTV